MSFYEYEDVVAYAIEGNHYHPQCLVDMDYPDDEITKDCILTYDDLKEGHYFCDHCKEVIKQFKVKVS